MEETSASYGVAFNKFVDSMKVFDADEWKDMNFKRSLINEDLKDDMKDVPETIKRIAIESQSASEAIDRFSASQTFAAKSGEFLKNSLKSIAFASLEAVISAVAVTIITKAITAIDEYIHREEILRNKISDTSNSLKEQSADIEDLNKCVEENNKKMDELARNDVGEIIDKEELTKLQLANKDLQRQIELKERLRALEANEQNDDVNKALGMSGKAHIYRVNDGDQKQNQQGSSYLTGGSTMTGSSYGAAPAVDEAPVVSLVVEGTPIERLQAYKNNYDALKESLASLNQEKDNGEITDEEYQRRSQAINKSMEDISKKALEQANDIRTLDEALDENGEGYKDTHEACQKAIDDYLNWSDVSESGLTGIERATKNYKSEVEDGVDGAKALMEALDAGKIEEGGDAYDYAAALAQKYGVEVDTLIEALQKLHDEENQTSEPDWHVDTAAELVSLMKDLSESSGAYYDKVKALTGAYNSMYQDQRLSSDAMQSLLAVYPDLISQMEVENGVVKISKDVLSDKFDAIKGAMIATVQSEMEATKAAINEAQTRIKTYQAEITAISALYSAIGGVDGIKKQMDAGYVTQYNKLGPKQREALKGYWDSQKVIEDATAQLEQQQKTLDVLSGLTLANYSGATKGASSATKGATAAAKEHKKALESQKKALEETKDSLDKYANKLKVYGQAAIDEIEKRIDAIEKDKDAQTDAIDAEIKKLQEQEKAQNKVYENQIKELQEKKEALEKANDEEDRAIKLAELQDALARARAARTTRVYTKNEGFVWRADQSAVDDAQKELDDQMREWKNKDILQAIEDEIDKINDLKDALSESTDAQVEALEKRKDAIEEAAKVETDKLKELKDKWSEVVGLIGTSWEDYQEKLRAMAEFSGMTYEQMGAGVDAFKDKVIENMKSLGEVTNQIEALTNAISKLDTDSGSDDGSGGGGSGFFDGMKTGADDAADSIEGANERLDKLKKTLEISSGNAKAFNDTMLDYNRIAHDASLSDEERRVAFGRLIQTGAELHRTQEGMTSAVADYIVELLNEKGITEEARQSEIEAVQSLATQYGVDYADIMKALEDYRNGLDLTKENNKQTFDDIGQVISTFKEAVNVGFDQVESSSYKICAAASKIKEDWATNLGGAKTIIDEFKRAAQEAANIKVDVLGGGRNTVHPARYASGTLGVESTHIAITDEAGPEIKIRPTSGQYSLMTKGSSVIPAQPTANLWKFGLDPDAFLQQHIKQRTIGDIEIKQPKAARGAPVINVGDIKMYGVNDVESFGRVIHERAATVFAQEFSK